MRERQCARSIVLFIRQVPALDPPRRVMLRDGRGADARAQAGTADLVAPVVVHAAPDDDVDIWRVITQDCSSTRSSH